MATIRNPQNGRKIFIGGSLYNTLVEEGVLEPVGTIPNIENFIFIPNLDIWIRRNSQKYKTYLEKHSYVVQNDMLVPKSKYNTSEPVTTRKMKKTVAKGILECGDILRLILREASKSVRTYCCLRSVSKLFRSSVDKVAPYEDILCSFAENRTSGVKHVSSIPPKALNIYVTSYPLLLIKTFFSPYTTKKEILFIRKLVVKQLKYSNEQFKEAAKQYFFHPSFDMCRS